MIMALGSEDRRSQTVYQQHGKDLERIKGAMKKPCCKVNCKRHLSVKTVIAMSLAFWSISKAAQDALLLLYLISAVFFGAVNL
jgi:hypothetical protein